MQIVMPSSNLQQLEDAVHDEETFLVFLQALSDDRLDEETREKESPSNPYGSGHNGWENGTIASAWADVSKNGLPLMTKECNPWKRVAQILHAGKIYE